MFSATSNRGLEKIVYGIFGNHKILSFKSEFEMIHKVSTIGTGDIKPCLTFDNVLAEV
jgi:hypothetical protein